MVPETRHSPGPIATVSNARKSRAPIAPPALRVAGFSLRGKDEGFVVWSLMPDSPAAAAGLKDGDVVSILPALAGGS